MFSVSCTSCNFTFLQNKGFIFTETSNTVFKIKQSFCIYTGGNTQGGSRYVPLLDVEFETSPSTSPAAAFITASSINLLSLDFYLLTPPRI